MDSRRKRMGNGFFHDGSKVGKRTVVAAALICLVAAAVSCRTIKTVEVPVTVHDTAYISKEVHDSVWIENTVTEYMRGDTVYRFLRQVQYVERVHVDTIMTYKDNPVPITIETTVTQYVEKQIPWWKKTLMYFGIFFIIGVLFFFVILIIKTKT